jgi:hypothetical protein
MKLHHLAKRTAIASIVVLSINSLSVDTALAADVVVTPSAGSNFVVKNSAGSADRLRVNEAGAVAMPAVPSATVQSIALCADAVGVLGPCVANAGFSLPFAGSGNTSAALFDITQNGSSSTSAAIVGRRGSSGIVLGSGSAILGDSSTGVGVAGTSGGVAGVYGTSTASHGVWGVGVVSGFGGVTGRNDVAGGYGVQGQSLGGGVGVFGFSQTGNAGQFDVTNAASTGDAVRATQAGLGRGVYGVINNASNIVAAVRGETNGTGYGVFGQATGNGNAGFFQISNAASTSSTVNVTTNGIGSGVTVQLTNVSNGARGVDVLQAGVGPGVFATSAGGNAVWGITSSISAAGVIGDNTFGEAVVGRNRGGPGVGAVVGRNDDNGYGVRGFNTKAGIGVLGQAGISGGTGTGGRFENVNAANGTDVLVSVGNGTGAGLRVDNANAGATNLAVFQKSGGNVARIDSTGKGFFNGGTQTGGADVAELIPHVGRLPVPGDVVMIDVDNPMHYRVADEANSAAVAGVITTKPGVLMNAGVEDVGDAPALALVGRVPVKVTDEGGSIRVGDLLVSSSTPGHAMKAPNHPAPGTIVGKALQPHGSGSGTVEMLVMLR